MKKNKKLEKEMLQDRERLKLLIDFFEFNNIDTRSAFTCMVALLCSICKELPEGLFEEILSEIRKTYHENLIKKRTNL